MFEDLRRKVKKIRKGKVATYCDVAIAAGHPRGARQVAWSLRTFDPSLPWHRVIGRASAKWGKILLRGAGGVDQMQRLEAEGVAVQGIRVDLQKFGHRF